MAGILLNLTEDAFENAGYIGRVPSKRRFKFVQAPTGHPLRDHRSLSNIGRQQMGLQSVLHLEAVFEAPKKFVGIKQSGQLGLGDDPTVAETREADQRVRSAQPPVASSICQLKRLSDKLDLANAAPPKLYVKSRSLPAIQVDLLLGLADVR